MTEMTAKDLVERIEIEVRRCAKIITDAVRSEEMVEAKDGFANFVTTYDKKVQEELEKGLLSILPDAAFAGEENEKFSVPDEGFVFIVDPIDGTTNFICDLHASCISVGVLKDGQQYVGVVYNPYLDEMYTAIKNQGAYLNGKRIHVTTTPFERGLGLFGTSPYNRELGEKSFAYAYKLFGKCADMRRGGSAAIDFCTVAAGRANIFFECILSPWDFAAGSLIVTEAGGKVTTFDGGEPDFTRKCGLIARSSNMEEIVGEVFGV